MVHAKFKKALSLLLTVMMAVTALVQPAQAVTPQAETQTKPQVVYPLGDVNRDSTINAQDALVMLQSAVQLCSLTGLTHTRADVNGSGDINAVDALLALQYAVRKIDTFPYEEEYNTMLDPEKTLQFNENGEFRVLQFSDLHITAGNDGFLEDTVNQIRSIMEVAEPDLVMITGDILYDGYTGNTQTDYAMDKKILTGLNALFAECDIPWCTVFGNHDDFATSKDKQLEIFTSLSHCLTEPGYVVNDDRKGNYVLPVLSADGESIALNVWALDTGGETGNASDKYDYILKEQIDWYKNTSAAYEQFNDGLVPGVMFGHIPLPEFKEIPANPVETGMIGVQHEDVCSPKVNSGMFNALVERGDVMGFYCGHDHINNFSGIYRGIELAYDGSLAHSAYGGYHCGIPEYEVLAGGRLLTVSEREPHKVKSEFLSYDDVVKYRNKKTTETPAAADDSTNLLSFEGEANVSVISAKNSPECTVDAGVGYQASGGLTVTTSPNNNTVPSYGRTLDNIELSIDLETPYTLSEDSRYLRLWLDTTAGIDFRKASFGVITSDGTVYATKYYDAQQTFYKLPENSPRWSMRRTDTDGCFGSIQSSVKDFKGWLAFPLSNMKSSNGASLSASDEIQKIFLYFDINSTGMSGKAFCLDSLSITGKYWVFGEAGLEAEPEPVLPKGGTLFTFEEEVPNIHISQARTAPTFELSDGKGADGSKALAVTKKGDGRYTSTSLGIRDSCQLEMDFSPVTAIDGGYLLFWIDLSEGIDFRKASFGVNDVYGTAYDTDFKDTATDNPFYIKAAGEDTWVTMSFGNDGCLGTQQNSSIAGFRGYLAVPIKGLLTAAGVPLTGSVEVDSFRFWFDFASDTMEGKTFYLDDVRLVGPEDLPIKTGPAADIPDEIPTDRLMLDFEANVPIVNITSNTRVHPVFTQADDKGFDGSHALAVTKDGDGKYAQQSIGKIDNCFMLMDSASVDIGDSKYLLVWMDVTEGVDFRKASFGFADTNGTVYDCDNKDGRVADLAFYTKAEGSDTWVEMSLGDDGCLGTDQNSSIGGFRGWIAIPLKHILNDRGNPISSSATVNKFYMYFDFASINMEGKTFYLDQVVLV